MAYIFRRSIKDEPLQHVLVCKRNNLHILLQYSLSTFVITFNAEITLRMIPAAALILYADYSKYPMVFKLFGWFMLATSIILYLVPPKLHHQFSNWCADMLKPFYFQLLSPFAFLFGVAIIYCVI